MAARDNNWQRGEYVCNTNGKEGEEEVKGIKKHTNEFSNIYVIKHR